MDDESWRERRTHPRVPISTRVDIVLENHSSFVSEHTSDISEGGMFIETTDPWPEGTVFGFGFRPRRGIPPLRGTAEVVWVRYTAMGPGQPVGMGARFLDLDARGLEIIRSLIAFEVESAAAGAAEVFEMTDGGAATAAPVEHADVFPRPGETGVVYFGDDSGDRPATGQPERRPALRRALVIGALAVVVAIALVLAAWKLGVLGGLPDLAIQPGIDGAALSSGEGAAAGAVGRDAPPAPTAARVLGIAWTVKEGQTVVSIRADGSFDAAAVRSTMLENPARFVIRLSGIVEAYRPDRIPSTGPGMAGIRVGHHADGDEPQLHVVLDLGPGDVQVAPIELHGDTLAVRVIPES